MELFKSKGLKALSVSLIAAAALVITVIVIAFSGASSAAKKPPAETTAKSEASRENPTADLAAGDPSDSTGESSTEDKTKESTEIEETTKEPPALPSLAFLTNGDGTCTVTGIGTYKKTEIDIPTISPAGDIVTAVAGYAFYNEASLVRISLPSTVRSIGEYAFFGCSNLIEITVSSSNTAFTVIDGILYTKDGSRLLFCPPMRGKTTCTIKREVSVVESGAFSDVKYLKTVYYEGTAADYTEINIFAHNEMLDKLRLVCNYTEEK